MNGAQHGQLVGLEVVATAARDRRRPLLAKVLIVRKLEEPDVEGRLFKLRAVLVDAIPRTANPNHLESEKKLDINMT